MLLRTEIRRIPPVPENAVIALIVAIICAACWYGAEAFEARAERPIVVARSAPPFIVRKDKQDRIEQAPVPDVIQPRPVPTTPYLLVPGREALLTGAPVRIPWSCTILKRAVAEFGREAVRKFLKEKRHTTPEIDEAMACLAEKRT